MDFQEFSTWTSVLSGVPISDENEVWLSCRHGSAFGNLQAAVRSYLRKQCEQELKIIRPPTVWSNQQSWRSSHSCHEQIGLTQFVFEPAHESYNSFLVRCLDDNAREILMACIANES